MSCANGPNICVKFSVTGIPDESITRAAVFAGPVRKLLIIKKTKITKDSFVVWRIGFTYAEYCRLYGCGGLIGAFLVSDLIKASARAFSNATSRSTSSIVAISSFSWVEGPQAVKNTAVSKSNRFMSNSHYLIANHNLIVNPVKSGLDRGTPP